MKTFIPYRLRIAREVLGFSLDELSIAMHSCVTKQSLSKYEQGTMSPRAKRMDYLAEAMGVPKQFFTGEGMSIDIPKLRKSSQRKLTEKELRDIESIILFHAERFKVNANDEDGDINNLTANQKDTIDKVLDYYAGHDAQWLSQLTHMEDPWNEARVGIPLGIGCSNIITKDSMAVYYGGL